MRESTWTRRIHEPFIAGALCIALTEGFGYATLLVLALALRVPLGAWWVPAVQAHGHAQLFGWMGMFILGMGLHFLPRLRGARLLRTEFAAPAFWLLVIGIALRSLAQAVLGLLTPGAASAELLRMAWALSALLELAGACLIGAMLVATARRAAPLLPGAPAYPVLPFLLVAAASGLLAFLLNAVGTWLSFFGECSFSASPLSSRAVLGPCTTIAGPWDALIIELMLYGLALPVAFVFSVRNLPLYLRLAAPPRRELRYLAAVYAAGLALRLLPDLSTLAALDAPWMQYVGALGIIVQSLVIVDFILRLDLLHRRPPWTVDRAAPSRPELEHLRRATRKGYPDAGEYGRFELLIYSGYAWLAIAAILGFVYGLAFFAENAYPIPADAVRHSIAVGFITLLILGMAVRMAPGLSGKRRVAYPGLVLYTFLLGNLAALLRVVPLFFPASGLALALLGASGAFGWLAVALLAVNLAATFKLPSPAQRAAAPP